MKLYSAQGLADEAKVSYRQVHYWTAKGWITPVEVEGVSTSGTGNARVYDEKALLACQLLAVLLDSENVGSAAGRVASTGAATLPWGFRITRGGAA